MYVHTRDAMVIKVDSQFIHVFTIYRYVSIHAIMYLAGYSHGSFTRITSY